MKNVLSNGKLIYNLYQQLVSSNIANRYACRYKILKKVFLRQLRVNFGKDLWEIISIRILRVSTFFHGEIETIFT